MACNYPITAYKCEDGGIVFDERKGAVACELRLPCGQCDGCRLERARQWAVRCVHESMMYEENIFLTLTYNDENLPDREELLYRDFQLFMKRLRKEVCYYKKSSKHQGPYREIRFFMCGEYGEDNGRPHYHACIFNLDFQDKKIFKKTSAGSYIYTSETLDRIWGKGFATIGDVNFDSAGYVARYITKKSRKNMKEHFIDIETGEIFQKEDEFTKMSLKPGIGRRFYDKWKRDIFPHDHVVVNGKVMKPPKYYYKLLQEENENLYNELLEVRLEKSLGKAGDNTPERLETKELVLKASMKFLKREL